MATIKPPLGILACSRAIKHFGKESQLDVSIEEMSELIKAILKYRRHGYIEEHRLLCVDEIADVSIMLEQLIIMLSDKNEFQKVRNYKLKRLNNIIDSDISQVCETSENDYQRCIK